jgi:phosphatidylethanolamine-binding protein (PEBP) family uncharacterized protein
MATLALVAGSVTLACSSGGGSPGGEGGAGGDASGGSGGSSGSGGARSGGSGGGSQGGSGGGGLGGASGSGGGGAGGGSGGASGSGGGGAGGGSGGASGSGGSGGAKADGGATDGATGPADMGTMATDAGSTGAFTFSGDFLMISMNRLCHKKEQTSSGGNISPELKWSGLPADTKSIAVSLKDRMGGTHWVMCNIPTTVMGLPRDINKAMQIMGSQDSGNWYGPGAGLPYRTYEYRVWALKVPMLPGGCTNKNAAYPAMLTANEIEHKELLVLGTAAGTCPQ